MARQQTSEQIQQAWRALNELNARNLPEEQVQQKREQIIAALPEIRNSAVAEWKDAGGQSTFKSTKTIGDRQAVEKLTMTAHGAAFIPQDLTTASATALMHRLYTGGQGMQGLLADEDQVGFADAIDALGRNGFTVPDGRAFMQEDIKGSALFGGTLHRAAGMPTPASAQAPATMPLSASPRSGNTITTTTVTTPLATTVTTPTTNKTASTVRSPATPAPGGGAPSSTASSTGSSTTTTATRSPASTQASPAPTPSTSTAPLPSSSARPSVTPTPAQGGATPSSTGSASSLRTTTTAPTPTATATFLTFQQRIENATKSINANIQQLQSLGDEAPDGLDGIVIRVQAMLKEHQALPVNADESAKQAIIAKLEVLLRDILALTQTVTEGEEVETGSATPAPSGGAPSSSVSPAPTSSTATTTTLSNPTAEYNTAYTKMVEAERQARDAGGLPAELEQERTRISKEIIAINDKGHTQEAYNDMARLTQAITKLTADFTQHVQARKQPQPAATSTPTPTGSASAPTEETDTRTTTVAAPVLSYNDILRKNSEFVSKNYDKNDATKAAVARLATLIDQYSNTLSRDILNEARDQVATIEEAIRTAPPVALSTSTGTVASTATTPTVETTTTTTTTATSTSTSATDGTRTTTATTTLPLSLVQIQSRYRELVKQGYDTDPTTSDNMDRIALNLSMYSGVNSDAQNALLDDMSRRIAEIETELENSVVKIEDKVKESALEEDEDLEGTPINKLQILQDNLSAILDEVPEKLDEEYNNLSAELINMYNRLSQSTRVDVADYGSVAMVGEKVKAFIEKVFPEKGEGQSEKTTEEEQEKSVVTPSLDTGDGAAAESKTKPMYRVFTKSAEAKIQPEPARTDARSVAEVAGSGDTTAPTGLGGAGDIEIHEPVLTPVEQERRTIGAEFLAHESKLDAMLADLPQGLQGQFDVLKRQFDSFKPHADTTKYRTAVGYLGAEVAEFGKAVEAAKKPATVPDVAPPPPSGTALKPQTEELAKYKGQTRERSGSIGGRPTKGLERAEAKPKSRDDTETITEADIIRGAAAIRQLQDERAELAELAERRAIYQDLEMYKYLFDANSTEDLNATSLKVEHRKLRNEFQNFAVPDDTEAYRTAVAALGNRVEAFGKKVEEARKAAARRVKQVRGRAGSFSGQPSARAEVSAPARYVEDITQEEKEETAAIAAKTIAAEKAEQERVRQAIRDADKARLMLPSTLSARAPGARRERASSIGGRPSPKDALTAAPGVTTKVARMAEDLTKDQRTAQRDSKEARAAYLASPAYAKDAITKRSQAVKAGQLSGHRAGIKTLTDISEQVAATPPANKLERILSFNQIQGTQIAAQVAQNFNATLQGTETAIAAGTLDVYFIEALNQTVGVGDSQYIGQNFVDGVNGELSKAGYPAGLNMGVLIDQVYCGPIITNYTNAVNARVLEYAQRYGIVGADEASTLENVQQKLVEIIGEEAAYISHNINAKINWKPLCDAQLGANNIILPTAEELQQARDDLAEEETFEHGEDEVQANEDLRLAQEKVRDMEAVLAKPVDTNAAIDLVMDCALLQQKARIAVVQKFAEEGRASINGAEVTLTKPQQRELKGLVKAHEAQIAKLELMMTTEGPRTSEQAAKFFIGLAVTFGVTAAGIVGTAGLGAAGAYTAAPFFDKFLSTGPQDVMQPLINNAHWEKAAEALHELFQLKPEKFLHELVTAHNPAMILIVIGVGAGLFALIGGMVAAGHVGGEHGSGNVLKEATNKEMAKIAADLSREAAARRGGA